MRLFVVIVLFGVACGGREAEPDPASAFGLRIGAHGGVPALDVAVHVQPSVREETTAQPAAQLVTDATTTCAAEASRPGAFDVPITLSLSIASGQVQPDTESPTSTGLRPCLTRAMARRPLPVPTQGRYTVTIQVMKASEAS